jgi:hypothetical protein
MGSLNAGERVDMSFNGAGLLRPTNHAGLPAPAIVPVVRAGYVPPRPPPPTLRQGYKCASCGASVLATEDACSYCTSPRPDLSRRIGIAPRPHIPQPERDTRR